MYGNAGNEATQTALLARMGATPEMIEKMRESAQVEVWTCNRDIVRVFGELQSQWRVGNGGATGLDYTAIPPTLDLLGITRAKDRQRIFAGIRVMEAAVLGLWSERREMERK